jgi:hypothetical protein
VRAVTRIVAYLVCVVIHVSGTPNPTIDTIGKVQCLSLDEAEERGVSITDLRNEYAAAVVVVPGQRPELATAWSELQYRLRDRLLESGLNNLGGRSLFLVMLFEPDGRIAWVFFRGLEPDEEQIFCEVVGHLAEGYRFPVESAVRFSQCGTTYFGEK